VAASFVPLAGVGRDLLVGGPTDGLAVGLRWSMVPIRF